jgi:hypothetical protein
MHIPYHNRPVLGGSKTARMIDAVVAVALSV